MSFTKEQKDQLEKLISYRDNIVDNLAQIQHIIKHYFPEEFEMAYQHWIPQITTALYDDTKWLPRGQFTMQQTIDRLMDDTNSRDVGVYKYIKKG